MPFWQGLGNLLSLLSQEAAIATTRGTARLGLLRADTLPCLPYKVGALTQST